MSLPNGYTQLEYLRSGGAQYIDTGVLANPHHSIEVSFKLTRNANVWDTVFGTRNGSNSRFTARFKNFYNGTLGDQYSSAGAGSATITESSLTKNDFDSAFRVLKFEKNVVSVDGVTTHTFSAPSNTVSYPYSLYLFANNNAGTAGDFGFLQIAYCKIWNDGVLIRDFIPAQNSEGVFGMYDLVNGVFYTNQGKGVFLSNLADVYKGVPASEYTKLEYIECDGAQYINTNYCATPNIRVVTNVNVHDDPDANNCIYGATGDAKRFAISFTSSGAWRLYYGDKTGVSYGGAQEGKNCIDHEASAAFIKSEDYNRAPYCSSFSFSGDGIYPMYIFAHNNAGNPITSFSMKLYDFKLYDAQVLVRWFIPVRRKSDNEVGLYDVENGVFYTNQGTGAFIAGADLPDDEWETDSVGFGMALIGGVAMPITGGMAMLNGTARKITEGVTMQGGVVKRIGA